MHFDQSLAVAVFRGELELEAIMLSHLTTFVIPPEVVKLGRVMPI
jgi:hypothetical protein